MKLFYFQKLIINFIRACVKDVHNKGFVFLLLAAVTQTFWELQLNNKEHKRPTKI